MAKAQRSRSAVRELRHRSARLAEAEDTLKAIRSGHVDTIVVDGPSGSRIFALQSPDDPYRILIERMNEGAATLTSDGTILFCNRRLAEMVGEAAERIVGSCFKSILDEKEWQGFTVSTRQALKNDVRNSAQLLRKDGTTLPVQLSFSRLANQRGRQVICVIATDLGDQKRAELKLREQAALLDLAPDAIVVRDMQSRILFWNRGAETIYGWSGEEALGKDSTELLKTEFFESAEAVRAQLLRQGHWEDDAIQCKRDGTRLVVASRSVLQRDAEGAPVRILTINNDVTDQRQAEARHASLTERLALATEVAKVGVWEWDMTNNALTWDSTMLEIYGLPMNSTVTYDQWAGRVHPDDLQQIEASLRKAIENNGEGNLEFRILRKDGSLRNISAVYRVFFDGRRKVRRAIGVSMDVTERKDAERALEQSRIDELHFKDELLSHVSHELRTPLAAMKQFSTILQDGLAGALNEKQLKYQQLVMKNIEQLQAMINDLLEVTRLENGKLVIKPDSISVSEVVTDAINMVLGSAQAKGVALSSDISPSMPAAYTDPIRLRQILLILIDNALRFTPSGGEIKIRARLSEPDAKFVLLEVSDTGCGIPPKDVNRIFERLYQVKPARSSRMGLGLGLFICEGLVVRQGGQIWVESKVNEGTTFSFTLPVFSVSTLIAPLLVNDKWPAKTVSLVEVQVWPREARPSHQAREYWSDEARIGIQKCLTSHLDMFLLQARGEGEKQRFFVAAFADEGGVSTLTERIREQFRLPPLLKGTDCSIFQTTLKQVPPESSVSAKDAVANMAAQMEMAIKSQTLSETTNHE
jgi:PAS domain S-box-containing protein